MACIILECNKFGAAPFEQALSACEELSHGNWNLYIVSKCRQPGGA